MTRESIKKILAVVGCAFYLVFAMFPVTYAAADAGAGAAGGGAAPAAGPSASGVGGVATNAIKSLAPIAKLITGGAYVAGFGFFVAAIVKFKAHKDNPTQVQISQPIALIFIAAALVFIPGVFKSGGGTLFGSGGTTQGVSGAATF
jgi:intracellular multiplication protein IcmD